MSDSTLYSVREAVLPPLPELLSPAGSPEALEAAVLAGADAVYLGAPSFNARIHAHNFGESELAYRMMARDEYPSYTHLLDLGFTSMPEKIMPDGEECGSHNHHFLGDVNRWFTCCST